MTKPKTKTVNDFSRCLDPLDMDATLIAVIEMSQSSWLVAGIVPGVEREPGGGLVPNADPFTGVHRALIVSLAAQNKYRRSIRTLAGSDTAGCSSPNERKMPRTNSSTVR